jgi:hypothetical protein
MKRFDYFTGALRAKAHYHREWVLRAMSVVVTPPKADIPWALRQTKEGAEVYVPNLGQEGQWHWEQLEGVGAYEIPFVYHDWAGPLKPGDVENVVENIDNTTWGDILFNSRVLVYSCGDLIPYTLGPINLGAMEERIVKNMADNPKPGEEPKPGQMYVYHYMRFGKAVGDLAGYELFVPSITERALQSPPNRNELRDSLLEQYKGQLEDPVVQTKIQTAMVDSYKDWIKGDPSEGFIYKNKSINTALKRMFLIHGPEAGFEEGGRATLVINSLEEGIDTTHYPTMVNSLRAGSYYRGALTALAGEDVDLMARVFQNVRILSEFCNTHETYDVKVTKDYIGRTLNVNRQLVKVTDENLSEFNGKIMPMYSTGYCKATRSDVCAICAGDKLAAFPESMGSMVGDIPSTMMLTMMGSAHAKELKTTPIDIENFLR